MENCQLLVDALKCNYSSSYNNFENAIVEFVENKMKLLSNDEWYFPSCLIIENLSAYGISIDIDKIILNKKIVTELMYGKKNGLIIIFHELTHIEQNMKIKNGESSPSILKFIKDKLMNEYQDTENKRVDVFNHTPSFYDTNYSCESSEIDANINAINLTIEFLTKNNISYLEEKQKFEKLKHYLSSNNFTKRDLSNCISFNSYCLTLDNASDVAIKYHPEWLKKYHQLCEEYILRDNSIEKKIKKLGL